MTDLKPVEELTFEEALEELEEARRTIETLRAESDDEVAPF